MDGKPCAVILSFETIVPAPPMRQSTAAVDGQIVPLAVSLADIVALPSET
ncbi:hypothetical protein OE766_21875 [Pararhizobium sp. YC-54]|nr:hypothetical protein [Pararhizobium sp. YC-54]MCW0000885.1 hypothetical protein [Pararhizobium sp. YC-54]